jgi:hypothetical protein
VAARPEEVDLHHPAYVLSTKMDQYRFSEAAGLHGTIPEVHGHRVSHIASVCFLYKVEAAFQ